MRLANLLVGLAFLTLTHATPPGSLELSLSVKSISNIVGLMAGLLPSYLIDN